MSAKTTYTMYRKDARGVIEVDLNDPVYSLDQLREKAQEILDDYIEKVRFHKRNLDLYEARVDAQELIVGRLEMAIDAARKTLGPSEREVEKIER